jgi:hypothetical protein
MTKYSQKKKTLLNPMYAERLKNVFENENNVVPYSHKEFMKDTNLLSNTLSKQLSQISGKHGYNFIEKDNKNAYATRKVYYKINYSGIIEYLFKEYLDIDKSKLIPKLDKERNFRYYEQGIGMTELYIFGSLDFTDSQLTTLFKKYLSKIFSKEELPSLKEILDGFVYGIALSDYENTFRGKTLMNNNYSHTYNFFIHIAKSKFIQEQINTNAKAIIVDMFK